MGLYNNVPTFTYVSATGVTVTYNDKIYTIQSFYTNKKYIYWDSDNATVLQASNTMPTRSTKTHLVIINDNGVATTVPSTSDNFSISYDGDSNESIKSRIYALYEKNKDLGDKYIAIEQDIEGIKQIVGSSEESQGSLIDRVSKIEQTSNNLELSVNTIEREYSDDKELTRLREDLNSSIITLNSGLGTLNSELQSYYKDDAISSEEMTSIEALLDEVVKSKLNLSSCLDRVLVITEKIGNSTNLLALNNAIKALDNSHENLTQNINIAIGDCIITPSEKTILIDAFAKYSLRITELKNVCDNIIFLGVGGVMIDELSKISVKSDEIRLSVSQTENNLKSDMNIQKAELDKKMAEIVLDKDSIKSTVSDLSGKYTQIKQTVDSIDLSGKVSFSDLSTSGRTTINGGNITTGTINASKAKITNINASNINTGSLSASLITAGTLDASKITVKNLSASSITSGTFSGDRISGGTISAANEINFNGGARIFGNTGAYDAGLTISAQAYSFNSGDASFQSSISACGGSLKLNRGSMYIPIYSGNETLDYIQGGNCKLGFTNSTSSNAIYFTLGSSGGGLLAHATIYLAHNGNTLCNFMRLGRGIIASPSSGSFHFVDTYGNASPLYTGTIWELRYYSEDEAQELSDDSVFDDINSINVINTKEGLGLINPTLSSNDDDNNYTVKTSYNEEKERLETSINHTSAISTLWKAVQELKSENEELKSLCKKMNEEIITLKKC